MATNTISSTPYHAQPSIFLKDVNSIFEKHLCDPDFSIDVLCKMLCMCRMQLHRKLKAETGLSASLFIRYSRLEMAKYLLASTALTVAEVAYDVGFSSPSYFTRSFVSEYRMTPSDYRNAEIPATGEKGVNNVSPMVTTPPVVTIMKGIVTQVQQRVGSLF